MHASTHRPLRLRTTGPKLVATFHQLPFENCLAWQLLHVDGFRPEVAAPLVEVTADEVVRLAGEVDTQLAAAVHDFTRARLRLAFEQWTRAL